MENSKAVILFDGECNFCNNAVNFIIAHDDKDYFRFAPRQSEIGQRLEREYKLENIESVILIEDDKAFIYSTAALKIAKNLNGAWKFFGYFLIVPDFIRDFFYQLFARYRHLIFGKRDACAMPTPQLKARYLS
ncbi:MAG: DUF393 domain-containing protein [Pyrinomonadaceae bacterium]|nr:DUF393 domain-containing protein [Pyrinomonadaceae bacterium]